MTNTQNPQPIDFAACQSCTREMGVIAEYWTDDAEFQPPYGTPMTEAERFAELQRQITNVRTRCMGDEGHRA